jgi:tripeptide aminopeptidase
VEQLASDLNNEEPGLKVKSKVEFSYPNMYKYIKGRTELEQMLKKAVKMTGLQPLVVPVRGGTDGAGLSSNGLLTPNIFTGAVNLHGPQEWISVTNMGYSLCTLLNILTQL